MPPPLQVDPWSFDLESDVRVTCDVGYYLCANFSLSRPLCSRLRLDIRDRQTSDAYQTGIINCATLYPASCTVCQNRTLIASYCTKNLPVEIVLPPPRRLCFHRRLVCFFWLVSRITLKKLLSRFSQNSVEKAAHGARKHQTFFLLFLSRFYVF